MIYHSAKHLGPEPYTDASPILGLNADGNTETTRLGEPAPFRQPEHGVAGFLAAGGVIEPADVPGPQPYRLYKSVFISRLTSDEAETMEAVLAGADAKLRLMFNSVEYFISDDPLFATLHTAVAQALGEDRADELLAA